MLSHWYNHDNLGNSLKSVKSASNVPKMESSFLKVPDVRGNSISIPQQQLSASVSSINSNKGSSMNLRDGSPNFRVPWKIILLGDAGVGKTSIIKQYLNGNFNANYNPTVEDSYLHNITLPDGLNQCIEILDTSGYYQFPAMRELNIRLGTAFILVFDLSKEETYKSLIELRQMIFTIKNTENIPIVIVGNKSDLKTEKTKNFLSLDEKIKFQYVQSSAKENINVPQIFKLVVDLIIKEIEETREALNAANISRRNSTISFVRRISTHNLMGLRADHSARRFSEPVCVENQTEEKISKKSDKSTKDSTKGLTTPTKRKQKNCIIS
ncbi:ras-related Rap-1b-like [Brachionus plicatilis]|uniref:Ras-related Rap-1b-like n=1 Tax=Brachionus plicatilis TaxID=10195 RepID=A0A3M7SYQ1_BRAPC|nr:ras-related Rap-1b-like [Brachionus plicatilis]